MSKHNTADMIEPGFLAALESERTYAGNLYAGTRRIKLEKGESALIRLLPVKMGASGSFAARIAQHWLNKKAVVCPRFTHSDFGGDSKAHCAACEATDEAYDQAATDEEKQFAKDASVKVKWTTWALLFERDTGRGKPEVIQPPEAYVPHEFSMSKTAFEEAAGLIQRSLRNKPDNAKGMLDPETGCDVWVTRTANNNYRLDKSDGGPSPIAEVDDKFDALVAQIMSECKSPSVRVASPEQLDAFALKFSDALANLPVRGGAGGGRGRPARGSDYESPRNRRDEEEAPRSRRASNDADYEEPRRRAPVQEETEPTPRRRAPAVEEAEPATRRRSAPEPEPEPATSRRPVREPEPEPEPATRASRLSRPAAPPEDNSNPELAPVPRRAARPAAEDAPPSRLSSPPPRRMAEPQDDPDDNAPEEANDPVPPSREEPAEEPEPQDEPSRPATTPLASAMRRNITKLGARPGV